MWWLTAHPASAGIWPFWNESVQFSVGCNQNKAVLCTLLFLFEASVQRCSCRWTGGRRHTCPTFTINSTVLHACRTSAIIRLSLAEHFAAPASKHCVTLTHRCSRVELTKLNKVKESLLTSWDFPPRASGCWYVLEHSSSPRPWCCAAQSAPFPPGPGLILRHQLFPGSPGSLHASHNEKMCFTLWPCRKHARGLIQLTCAPQCRYVTVWAQQQVLKWPDLILSSCDLYSIPRAEYGAA